MATTESTTAQIKEKPKFAPASVQTVTVPGPINAAATSGPGPILLRKFLRFKKGVLLKIEIWEEFS